MKKFLLIFLLYGTFLQAQNTTAVSPSNEFSYNEFLGYVKKYHPLVKSRVLKPIWWWPEVDLTQK